MRKISTLLAIASLSATAFASNKMQAIEIGSDDDAANRPLRTITATGTSDILDAGDALIYNDDRIHVYRTAIAIDYSCWTGDFYSDMDRVRDFWKQTEQTLNNIFGKQCGIYFKVIDDERLVIKEAGAKYPTSTSSINVITYNPVMFDELIGGKSYDYGCFVCNITDANGRSFSNGAYMGSRYGSSAAIASPNVIAHEAAHMFGSAHTNADDSSSGTYSSEPGSGQSLMASYNVNPWLSLVSLYRIRRNIVGADMSYYSDAEKTDLVVRENKFDSPSSYNNYVWGIPSDNHAPVINRENIKSEYTIPHGTLFKFDIDATDEDGDELEYTAQQIALYNRATSAAFRCMEPQKSSTIRFEPKWDYSYTSRGWKKLEYTDVDVTGTYTFWLAVNDISPDPDNYVEHPHAVGYDIVETKVTFAEGKPFKITNTKPSPLYRYTAGESLNLTWDVDQNIFSADSKVRILLSDDFGETYKYVLKESTANDGSCKIIFPANITIDSGGIEYGDTGRKINGGVIKVEEIGGIAYAVTRVDPADDNYNGGYYDNNGGFTLQASKVTFKDTPERYVVITENDVIPEVADVKAYQGTTQLNTTYSETTEDGAIYRVWEATDSYGNKSAFEQIIVTKKSSATTNIRQMQTTNNVEPEYFTLQGTKVAGTPGPGIYIRRAGNTVTKVTITH